MTRTSSAGPHVAFVGALAVPDICSALASDDGGECGEGQGLAEAEAGRTAGDAKMICMLALLKVGLTPYEPTAQVQRNLEKFVRRRQEGLPPHVVGHPVIV